MCCGSLSIADWANSTWAMNNSVAAPKSCCVDPTTVDCNVGEPGMPTNTAAMYTEVSMFLKPIYM